MAAARITLDFGKRDALATYIRKNVDRYRAGKYSDNVVALEATAALGFRVSGGNVTGIREVTGLTWKAPKVPGGKPKGKGGTSDVVAAALLAVMEDLGYGNHATMAVHVEALRRVVAPANGNGQAE